MNNKEWVLHIENDGEDTFDGQILSWMDGVYKIIELIEKDIPFTCTLDFIYGRGE